MITRNVVFKSLTVLAIALFSVTNAMYEKDKGKNEWTIESLGEISDLVFIGNNQAYTLSSDSLLTLYDTAEQKIVWKKQLPQGSNESY